MMIVVMDNVIKVYLSEIGRRGGKVSRRSLSSGQAREMVLIREARRAFKQFHSMCFWSFDPDYKIGKQDIGWVREQLRKEGNIKAWEIADRLEVRN